MSGTVSPSDFVGWVSDRLVEVHGDSPNVDFVIRLRRLSRDLRGDPRAVSNLLAEVRRQRHYELDHQIGPGDLIASCPEDPCPRFVRAELELWGDPSDRPRHLDLCSGGEFCVIDDCLCACHYTEGPGKRLPARSGPFVGIALLAGLYAAIIRRIAS